MGWIRDLELGLERFRLLGGVEAGVWERKVLGLDLLVREEEVLLGVFVFCFLEELGGLGRG